jgi:hypothetical protein
VRWTGHPACIRDMRVKFYSENLKVTNHLLDIDINRKTILKLLLKF